VPTATVCSTEFAALGHTEAAALGLAALPLAIIQHPLGGLRAEAVYGRAQSVIDTVQKLLTTDRAQLAAAVQPQASHTVF
jgi:hypothetical protein